MTNDGVDRLLVPYWNSLRLKKSGVIVEPDRYFWTVQSISRRSGPQILCPGNRKCHTSQSAVLLVNTGYVQYSIARVLRG